MKKLAAALLLAIALGHPQASAPFLEKPYLQLGNNPKIADPESLMLLWHTADDRGGWSAEVRQRVGLPWRVMPAPVSQVVAVRTVAKHYVWRAALTGLAPGEEFQ